MISKLIPYEDLKKVNAPYFDTLVQRSKIVIEGGWYVLGKAVEDFEKEFSVLHGGIHCLGVASGLDALILGLVAFDFPKGSKVLVPSNTYIASILAIIRADLNPVLVEPDPKTYNLTVAGLRKKYDKDCVAILPVHLYGRLNPMPEIVEFAKENNLKIVEDCAQSHFAEIGGVKSGMFGDIGAFSFYPTKNLGALGDAGAILCRDTNLYLKLKALRNYGSEKKYHNKYVGWNSRLDEIQASFLSEKLRDFKKVIDHKRSLAKIYFEELKGIQSITLPAPAGREHVWHIFNVLLQNRDDIKEKLALRGILTEIHYPVAPNLQEGYRSILAGHYPIAEKIHAETLSLPLSTCHTEEDIRQVSKNLKELLG
jgi:dTDP-4-amino-4,6-dideoxygalactose transaminase